MTMTTTTMQTDVGLVGAGPIGLELAVALKRAGLAYEHFDAGQIGQTISWFPPGTRFFSSNDRLGIAGVPVQTADQAKASREEYLAYLRQVVLQFGLRVRTYERVTEIERDDDGFLLTSRTAAGERRTRARRVVLTTGGTDRPRTLDVPGEDLPHVDRFFVDPHKYFQRRVLIVGGKNSAAEAALRCYHAGARVVMSYRRERFEPKHVKYWLLPELEGRIRRGEVECHFATQPTRITSTHVTLRRADGSTTPVAADFVLPLIGYVADMSLFRAAGVTLSGDQEQPTFDPETMETDVPGIYAAGTAIAGTQQGYRVFIENCHIHADRIVAALTGTQAPPPPAPQEMPES